MFVTFEGPEGSGKSTQISLLARYLRDEGYMVLETREPGGTSIGEQVRACLHDVNNGEMVSETEILLYSASRAQLVQEVIRPALETGQVVLCDRYADSTLAYQGYGRGLNLDDLLSITQFATGGLQPNLTLLLDVDIRRGLQRRESGQLEMNRMDLQKEAFYERVREGYRQLFRQAPERWVAIDANQPVNIVQREIRQTVMRRLAYS